MNQMFEQEIEAGLRSRRIDNRHVKMTRRDLAAIHVLATLPKKIWRSIEASSTVQKALLMKRPTGSTLMEEMNAFAAENGQFDQPLENWNQAARIIRFLRVIDLLYRPWDPADAAIVGDEHILVPKDKLYKLHREVIRRYGKNPLDWPDLMPYDLEAGQPVWRDSQFSGEAVSVL